MAFDGSGVFSRVHNWTEDKNNGIRITASRMDEEDDGFATAFNQVILRNGVVPFSGNVDFGGHSVGGIGDGSVGVPSISFKNDVTTGIWLAAPARMCMSTAGLIRAEFNNVGANFWGNVLCTGNYGTTASSVAFKANNIAFMYANVASGVGVFTFPQKSDDTAATVFNWTTFDGLSVKGSLTVDPTGNMILTATNVVLNASGEIRDKNGLELGYKEIPQNAQAGAYTLALTDSGKSVYLTGGAAAITVPPNSTTAFKVGTAITIVNDGSANKTITQGAGVTIKFAGVGTSGNVTLAPVGLVTILKVGTDTWFLAGAGAS